MRGEELCRRNKEESGRQTEGEKSEKGTRIYKPQKNRTRIREKRGTDGVGRSHRVGKGIHISANTTTEGSSESTGSGRRLDDFGCRSTGEP